MVSHAFTTRKGGVSGPPFESLNLLSTTGDDPEGVRENRRLVERVIGMRPEEPLRQIHSNRVIRLAGADPPSGVPADALITDEPGHVLSVYCADCAAVFILDMRRRAIGLAHAGWRGTVLGIACDTLAMMRESFGTRPQDCLAGISPAIGPCCFLVDDDVIQRFRKTFSTLKDLMKPVANKWSVDLWRANFRLLADRGVREDNISLGSMCTACRPELFFSHRREGGRTGRMAALFSLRRQQG
jgi:YfiH family protein